MVNELFRIGKSIYAWPLRMVWHRFTPDDMNRLFSHGLPERIAPVQLLISVPKKKRRHAVDRVLMRRRIREAYRISRLELKERVANDSGYATLSLAIVYMADMNEDYITVERSMLRILDKLQSRL